MRKDFLVSLLGKQLEIRAIIEHCGLSVVKKQTVLNAGETPPFDDVLRLMEIFKSKELPEVYATHSIRDFGFTASNTIAGFMVVTLSYQDDYLIFYRKPFKEIVKWAGNPEKLKFAEGKIQPRTSFDAWQSENEFRSEQWSDTDLALAQEFKDLIQVYIKEQSLQAQLYSWGG